MIVGTMNQKYIKKIVNDIGCNYKLVHLDKKNFLGNLTTTIDYHESPIASIAQYLHCCLMKNISDDNFKVTISGTAADEIFWIL